MPVHKIDLMSRKDKIIEWREEGVTRDGVLEPLKADGLKCSHSTLNQFLRDVDCYVQYRLTDQPGGYEAYRDRLIHYFQHNFTDAGIVEMLEKEGFSTSARTVRRIRISLGLMKRSANRKRPPPTTERAAISQPISLAQPTVAPRDVYETILYEGVSDEIIYEDS
ncbi:uncharacterized protein LTR77_001096 [Saxophila tyrrhenica]|uniref:Transposase n=1 Tax=Saxophila tyrrhenica TaxID=1690608 RepID=A0AAV9PJV2_9PEZI|nr:hypothetical protein LTR77_001096 [Saxophila tyrrhenica]